MDLFAEMISELKITRYPIVLYGAGFTAKRITKYLTSNGIDFAGYVVDSMYLPDSKSFLGKPVSVARDYFDKNECYVVVAFQVGFTEAKEAELSAHKNIKKTFALDIVGKFTIEGEDGQLHDIFLTENAGTLSKLRKDLADEESRLQLDSYIRQKHEGYLRKNYSKNPQYFDDDIVILSDNETFVDCGAYDGDTVLSFLECLRKHQNTDYPRYNKIFAFEADRQNAKEIERNVEPSEKISIIPKGVYDHVGTLCFTEENTSNSQISNEGIEIEVTTIDEATRGANVTFIKMDIEGSELKALKGAEKTILRCKPKLAVCVYHRCEDLITIPQYIQSLNPHYKLYFRNYSANASEAVLYAV